jgi:hypothetical protein
MVLSIRCTETFWSSCINTIKIYIKLRTYCIDICNQQPRIFFWRWFDDRRKCIRKWKHFYVLLLCTLVMDCMNYVLLVYATIKVWCLAQQPSTGPWPAFTQSPRHVMFYGERLSALHPHSHLEDQVSVFMRGIFQLRPMVEKSVSVASQGVWRTCISCVPRSLFRYNSCVLGSRGSEC